MSVVIALVSVDAGTNELRHCMGPVQERRFVEQTLTARRAYCFGTRWNPARPHKCDIISRDFRGMVCVRNAGKGSRSAEKPPNDEGPD